MNSRFDKDIANDDETIDLMELFHSISKHFFTYYYIIFCIRM